ncbi:MAG: YunC family protein [Candidatus Omnitrophota bacterium]
MLHQKVKLSNKEADGYVIPIGTLNLVSVVTNVGMVGCGAFDVSALDKFNYPAAIVKPAKGNSIAGIEDLLQGIIKDVNEAAVRLGVKVGMSGKEALEIL